VARATRRRSNVERDAVSRPPRASVDALPGNGSVRPVDNVHTSHDGENSRGPAVASFGTVVLP
jgi:hypothetical protein